MYFPYESSPNAGVQERFSRIIDRLRLLNVLVLLLQLEKWKIASVLHPERVKRDIAWKLFLTRRMRESPYNTPQELYTMQQQQLIWLV